MSSSTKSSEKKERRMKKTKSRIGKNKEAEPDVTTPRVSNDPIDKPIKEKIAAKTSKSAPTSTRMSSDHKQRVAETKRAIFCSLPKVITKNRAAAFTQLRVHLAGLHLLGLDFLFNSGQSFYTLQFDTVEHREIAQENVAKQSFKFGSEKYKLVVNAFGDPKKKASKVKIISYFTSSIR